MSDAAGLLHRVTAALETAKIPYMLTGSFASSVHGSPRTTQDIDLVVDPTFKSLDDFLALFCSDETLYLDADVARDEFKRRGQFNIIDRTTGWKLDMIYRKQRPFSREELSRRAKATVLGVDLFVASPEDVVLAKLEWAKLGESERQLRDVRGIVDVRGPRLDTAYIERWLDDLGVRELWDRVNAST